jgi:glutathione-regulated potassium-efflux system ancillary protein KefF
MNNPSTTASDAQTNAPIYVVAAHPNLKTSRVNRLLLQAATELPHVQVCDLFAAYPDYHIDIATEQARLKAAQLVVLVHPVFWYSMPALLKLWVDDVLTHGWAHGAGGNALRGKDLWLVATTGGPQDSYQPKGYNRFDFDAFLPPYDQTAALCGMRFLKPLILHGAHSVPSEDIKAFVATFKERITGYPAWSELN